MAQVMRDRAARRLSEDAPFFEAYRLPRSFGRFRGFPDQLTTDLMDRLLLAGLFLAGLSRDLRKQELVKLWESLAGDRNFPPEVMPRLMVSLADLAAGSSEQARLRAAVRRGDVVLTGQSLAPG
ncbi:MAG: hypothetical protein ACREX8_14750 [Gammaproteobacteria bacterium]